MLYIKIRGSMYTGSGPKTWSKSPATSWGHLRYCTVKLTQYRFRLLESGNFSDFKLVCAGRSWNLHSTIVATRCPWFRTVLNGRFLVSNLPSNKACVTCYFQILREWVR